MVVGIRESMVGVLDLDFVVDVGSSSSEDLVGRGESSSSDVAVLRLVVESSSSSVVRRAELLTGVMPSSSFVSRLESGTLVISGVVVL